MQPTNIYKGLQRTTKRTESTTQACEGTTEPKIQRASLSKQLGKSTKSPVTGQQRLDKKSLYATNDRCTDHLTLIVRIRGTEIRALIDTGAQGNFISPRIVNRLELPWKRKLTPYRLRTVNGELVIYGNGIVDMETAHIQVQIQNHCENLTCDITDITDYDLVLGIPWLRASNPRVNWNTGQFQWDTPGRDSVTKQRSKEPLHEPKTLRFYFINKDIDHNGIPKEYLKFLKLFSGKLNIGLP